MDFDFETARKMFPDLEDNVAKAGQVTGTYAALSNDQVHLYLFDQWVGLLRILPDAESAAIPVVLSTLGAVALTMERVNIPEFAVFQAVAADLSRMYDAVFEGVLKPSDGSMLH